MRKNISKVYLFFFSLVVVCLFFLASCTLSLDDEKGNVQDSLKSNVALEKQKDSSNFILHVIDVGHGDALLLKSKNPEKSIAILIDTGYSDQAEHVVDYLKKENITFIDAVIISHTDEDHIGGLPLVMDQFNVGVVYWNSVTYPTPSKIYDSFLRAIQNKSIVVTGPMNLTLGNHRLQFFIFFDKDNPSQNNDENSMIVYSDGYLLTGDCTYQCSQRLARIDLNVSVLKLPHHGSNESNISLLLDAFNPKFVVITDGKPFEKIHPASSTLQALKEKGIDYKRTFIEGNFII